MNITVCIKQVPATHDMTIDKITHTLIRDNVEQIINPSDENALEVALAIKDEIKSKVSAISMGNISAKSILRVALLRGVDDAYLINDSTFAGSDTYATAIVLYNAIKHIDSSDLVICGNRTIDGETGQVGPELAVLLGIPCITNVVYIEKISRDKIVCKRQIDSGYEILEIKLPALISVREGMNKLRLPSIMNMRIANEKEIIILDNQLLNIDKSLVGLGGSPTKVKKVSTPNIDSRNGIIKVDGDKAIQELAKTIKEKLDFTDGNTHG